MSLDYFTTYSASLNIKKEAYDVWVSTVDEVVSGYDVRCATGEIFRAYCSVESNPDLVVVGTGHLNYDGESYMVSSLFELVNRDTKEVLNRAAFWDEVPEYVKLELFEGLGTDGEDEYSLVSVRVTDDVPLDLDDSFYTF